jgi:hypothetical protein
VIQWERRGVGTGGNTENILWPDPDPLYVDDEPWPLYPAPIRRNHRWLIAALAVLALIAWRRSRA